MIVDDQVPDEGEEEPGHEEGGREAEQGPRPREVDHRDKKVFKVPGIYRFSGTQIKSEEEGERRREREGEREKESERETERVRRTDRHSTHMKTDVKTDRQTNLCCSSVSSGLRKVLSLPCLDTTLLK